MPKTPIRHAVSADFETLLEIDQASFPGGVSYDATELAYFMHGWEAVTTMLKVDMRLLAFPMMEVLGNRGLGTVATLDVNERHRRNGYGPHLLMRSRQTLPDYGAEIYDLKVDVTTPPAIIFYKKHG